MSGHGFRSATSCSGVMSRNEVKDFPVLPDVVMLAFERKQVSCLQRELQGPLERQLQVLDIMLDIFSKDTKAQEGIAEATLDVLIFILRTSNLEEVAAENAADGGPGTGNKPAELTGEAADKLKLKVKICHCLELLAKYPNGREELVRDVMKLEDFRYAVQWTESYEIKMSVRETCKLICLHPAGADALIQAGYWLWVLASIEIDTDPRVRSSSFALLCCLRRQCNEPVPVKPEVIKLLLKEHFTQAYGVDYCLNLLDFCHAICRQHEHKNTFLENGGLELCFLTFIWDLLQKSTNGGMTKEEESLCAKALEFLATLCVMVEGKQRFKEKSDCRRLFYDSRVLSPDHPLLYKTAVQLMLMVAEQPDVRAELKESIVVQALRKLQGEKTLDEFQQKILAKCLALLFWEP